MLKGKRFAALYSTSAPYTDHLVARTLHRETGLPWVADFRDPWLDNSSLRFATRWHRQLCGRIERSILQESSRAIIVGPEMKERLLQRYSDLEEDQIEVIRNGFDRADLASVAPVHNPASQFIITYTGSFYGQRQSGRTLFLALRKLIDAGSLQPEKFALRLVGLVGKETPHLIDELRLHDVVELVGFVSHRDALAYQLGADALLLIVGNIPGNEVVLQGKLYEYLATERPILCLAPPGATAGLIGETQTGIVAHPDNVEDIASALMKLFATWENGERYSGPEAHELDKYDRRHQTRQLATILDEICA